MCDEDHNAREEELSDESWEFFVHTGMTHVMAGASVSMCVCACMH